MLRFRWVSPGTSGAHVVELSGIDLRLPKAPLPPAGPAGSARPRNLRDSRCRRRPAPWSETARPPSEPARRASLAPARRRRNGGPRPTAGSQRTWRTGASVCALVVPVGSRSCSSIARLPPATGRRRARRTSSRECRRRGPYRRAPAADGGFGASHLLTPPDLLAHLGFADLEWQQALRSDRRLDFLVGD